MPVCVLGGGWVKRLMEIGGSAVKLWLGAAKEKEQFRRPG